MKARRRVLRPSRLVGRLGTTGFIAVCGAAVMVASATAAALASGPTLVAPTKCGQEIKYLHTPAENKLLATLPVATRAAYNVWPFAIKSTPWKTFKGRKGPWKIGYIDFPLSNAWQVNGFAQTKKDFAAAKRKGLVKGKLVSNIQASFSTATPEQQIAAIQQMVRQGVDGILLHPLNADAEAAAVDEAGKAGIPIVLELGIMPTSKYAVNFAAHNFAVGPALAQLPALGLADKQLNALFVRGVTSYGEEQKWYEEGLAALKACSNIKLVGEVVGNWSLPTVKTEVLKFLASHPEHIDVVLQNGIMEAPVIQAFEQTGRPVPLIPFNNTEAGGLAWWNDHKDTYKTAGTSINGFQAHHGAFRVLLRILAGNGLKVRDVHVPSPTITSKNLQTFVLPGADLNTDKESNAPLDFWASNKQLDGYFTKPGTPGGI
jgi:ribose transport system substrate-binding protein